MAREAAEVFREEDGWQDASEVPQEIWDNAAYAVRRMYEDGQPTPLSRRELRGLLVAVREFVPSIGTFLDGE